MTLHSHANPGLKKQCAFGGAERMVGEDIDDRDDERISDDTGPSETSEKVQLVVLIDDRTLVRECLQRSLASWCTSWEVLPFNSPEEWQAAENLHRPPDAILFHANKQGSVGSNVANQIRDLVFDACSIPVIILADSDDIVQLSNALEYGVRGYIPASVSIKVCVEAIKLALAGGIYVPASSVFAVVKKVKLEAPQESPLTELFTPRQIKVANALRQGKPNKVIAYELNMCESTVKVHVRNIMKKLKVSNRTAVAYKVRDLFPERFR